MSFELKPELTLRKNIRRLVRKQLEDALEELSGKETGSRDDAVHEVRKRFKKVRAVLRLVRPVIGARTYRAENICFRDAARPLSEVRDAKILIESLQGLVKHFEQHIGARAFSDICKALQDNLRGVRARVLDEQNAFAVATEAVRHARDRVRDWVDIPNRWSAVGRGLEDTYRQASAAFAKASANPAVDKLHEWRKHAKYLRYQIEVLLPLWPERLEEWANEADRMGDLLGDDHDLGVLRQMMTDDPDRFGDLGDREMLLALIDRRRAELQEEAMLLGRRFFEERPREVVRRVKGYWKTWRAQAEATTLIQAG